MCGIAISGKELTHVAMCSSLCFMLLLPTLAIYDHGVIHTLLNEETSYTHSMVALLSMVDLALFLEVRPEN